MAIQLTTSTTSYDQSRPVRETIRATGRLAVTSVASACEGAELVRDVLILARETLKESVIEARIDARTAEIAGLTKLHQLEVEYQATLASLQA
jgi:hypothetical protein